VAYLEIISGDVHGNIEEYHENAQDSLSPPRFEYDPFRLKARLFTS
jgi:hypothetical protein